MMGEFFKPGKKGDETTKKDDDKKHDYSSGQLGDIEKKVEDEGFEVIIRGLAISPEPSRPDKMMNDLFRSLNQYNYIGLNSIKYQPFTDMQSFLESFIQRLFMRPDQGIGQYFKGKHPMILNIKELASIFHFPHGRFNKNPRIKWQKYKIVAAPDNIPEEGISLGQNLYG